MGETILNQEWVLSAAHCCEHKQISDINVVVGLHELPPQYTSEPPEYTTEQKLDVLEIVMHPEYALESWIAVDICLLKVSPMTFSSDVDVVCLPEPHEQPPPDAHCYIAGWGDTSSEPWLHSKV